MRTGTACDAGSMLEHVLSRRSLLLGAASGAAAAGKPAAYGATPSARQLAWHRMEFYGFLHFTMNTFTDKEWGYGDEDPNLFHPSAFDPDAIAAALAASGMKGVILTCKHHDGFCLWPTRTTRHSVAASSWMDGKGDVVRSIAHAARRHGLKFGVYLSPWDRNSPFYGKPEYVDIYRAQLRELLTGYGEIFEVWHDGANGGDGYYGGAREKRLIDKQTYYGWPATWAMVRELQPGAVIFSDVGPDIRWVGNEKGYANETCWATYDPVGVNGDQAAPGYSRSKEGMSGHRNGKQWMPAECDVSIRPGWFWHERENDRVKTPRQLLDLYYRSVGRGASFLLNVPPDRRGVLHESDVASLRGLGELLNGTFGTGLAKRAQRRNTEREIVLDLGKPAAFNVVRLREQIDLGQRVDAFALDAWSDGAWKTAGEGTSIGACRILRMEQPLETARVRLRITQSAAAPQIAEFGLFREKA